MLTISAYSHLLGVHPQTVRRWEREGRGGLITPIRTSGNHRRYPVKSEGKQAVGYARVSCHDQKDDLPRQIDRLTKHGLASGKPVLIVKDVGSGLNCNKPGLRKLLALLLSGTVSELILTYKDRLLRFGSELVFFICKRMGITVTVLDSPEVKTVEETFTEDVLAILTVFSAKLYGARSHRKTKSPIAA